jgi:hypothetical protein
MFYKKFSIFKKSNVFFTKIRVKFFCLKKFCFKSNWLFLFVFVIIIIILILTITFFILEIKMIDYVLVPQLNRKR